MNILHQYYIISNDSIAHSLKLTYPLLEEKKSMKKLIPILLLSFISIFAFSEDFKGFMDIPFGTPTESCKKQMKSKGYRPLLDSSLLVYSNVKTYGGKKVSSVTFDCTVGYLRQITVKFENQKDSTDVLNALVKKYALIKSSNCYYTKDYSIAFTLSATDIIILTTKTFNAIDYNDL